MARQGVADYGVESDHNEADCQLALPIINSVSLSVNGYFITIDTLRTFMYALYHNCSGEIFDPKNVWRFMPEYTLGIPLIKIRCVL